MATSWLRFGAGLTAATLVAGLTTFAVMGGSGSGSRDRFRQGQFHFFGGFRCKHPMATLRSVTATAA
jgi:hypothetical protein